jgi:molybdopterin-containing oxidoreductase family membrane subunit
LRPAAGTNLRLLSLGWDGSQRTWARYETASLLLAGLATPLVISVHSIVSMDFATSILPGWHATIFPPYFVAGAVYSGFGMVMLLLIITRRVMNLERYITLHHLDRMAKITLLTGSLVAFLVRQRMVHRMVRRERGRAVRVREPRDGSVCAGVLDDDRLQRRCAACGSAACAPAPPPFSAISVPHQRRMWCERFVIIVTSLHRSYLPSSWGDTTRRNRDRHAARHLRTVLHLLSLLLHPAAANDRRVKSRPWSERTFAWRHMTSCV